LIPNQQARIAAVQITDRDQELFEEIKKESGGKIESLQGMTKVPKNMEKKIISRFHDDAREGHQGLARTMEKIQRDFYIPGLTRKIKQYINGCEKCQTNKHDNRKPYGKMIINKETPTKPWQHLAMDFMAMPDEESRRQILVVVDRFSKMTILIILPVEATTEEVFQAVWERVFAVFGIPESIISDLDKIFRSKTWKEKVDKMKVIHKLSTANHQRTDGQSERKIQEIQNYLRIYVEEMKDWEEWIPLLQYALNDAVSATTKETSFFVVFGRNRNEDQETTGMEERMSANSLTNTCGTSMEL
jgi:Integrase zinc binding domain/Integrase core domain